MQSTVVAKLVFLFIDFFLIGELQGKPLKHKGAAPRVRTLGGNNCIEILRELIDRILKKIIPV